MCFAFFPNPAQVAQPEWVFKVEFREDLLIFCLDDSEAQERGMLKLKSFSGGGGSLPSPHPRTGACHWTRTLFQLEYRVFFGNLGSTGFHSVC